MKISFPLSNKFTATASTFNEFEPLLTTLGFGSIREQPFGDGGILRPQVRVSQEEDGIVFNQAKDDWSGGPEWAKEVRAKAAEAGATLVSQERSREGKTTLAGTWKGRKYELQMHRSIGCKESAYFAKLIVR